MSLTYFPHLTKPYGPRDLELMFNNQFFFCKAVTTYFQMRRKLAWITGIHSFQYSEAGPPATFLAAPSSSHEIFPSDPGAKACTIAF